jgi:hypothetical protein
VESLDKLAVCHQSVLGPIKLTTHHGRWRKCPPKYPTRQYEPDSKTAPASKSSLGSHVDASAVAASLDRPEDSTSSMSPPPTMFVLFARLCPPTPTIVRPWPRQRRRCGMPDVIRFDVFIVVVVVVVVILGLDILCCGHRHLSRCAVASLVAPPPLSPRRHHYCRANACLIAPLLRQWMVVASSPLSPCQCLSCRAGASLVVPVSLLLRRGLSCGASPAPAGCRFAKYLNVPPSLLSRRLVVALLPLSLRR